MGCSDARTRHLPVIVAHRKANHTRQHPDSPLQHTPPSPIYLTPEYASAVTLPRISSESVKKMALAQRKKAF
jgi:hypothetical protein